MQTLKQRLDLLREEIQKEDFLNGKGLSNEVNIRFFCYDASEEMIVTHFLEQLKTDQSLNCRLIECNLYKMVLSICNDLDITEAIPEMEISDGADFLLEQLHAAAGEEEYIQSEQKRAVHQALHRLKLEYRQVLFLIYFEGLFQILYYFLNRLMFHYRFRCLILNY